MFVIPILSFNYQTILIFGISKIGIVR